MSKETFLTFENGKKMPALGYGTWQAKDDTLEAALEIALETGYRHIDTADAYENEHVIGKVLKRWFDSGKLKREDIFITTKLSPYNIQLDKIQQRVEQSLKKLQLDYVDLYLMHFPMSIIKEADGCKADFSINYLDIWKKMEDEYLAGRAKAIGISNFNPSQIERLLNECRIKPANLQIEMHVHLQQNELIDYCKRKGITIVGYSPIGSRGYNNHMVKNKGRTPKELTDILANSVVGDIAKKHGKTAAQILIRFVLESGLATVPKSVTPARIKENFDVWDFRLDGDDMNKLRGLDSGDRIFDFKFFGRAMEHPDFPL